MFAFEFDQALFEFAAARPQFAPLFELPPTIHSSYTVLPATGVVDFVNLCLLLYSHFGAAAPLGARF